MKKQREEKDYWDEYEDYSLDFSSNKLEYNGSSLDLPSSNEKKEGKREIKKKI